MDEQNFSGFQVGAAHKIAPYRKEGFRQCGRLYRTHIVRNRQALRCWRHRVLRVATAVSERTDLIPNLPAIDIRTYCADGARYLQAQYG